MLFLYSFLKRSQGCSNNEEEIIGADNFMCFKLNNEHDLKVQAFIPVTNTDFPVSHTITFYDDENLLTGLRRCILLHN